MEEGKNKFRFVIWLLVVIIIILATALGVLLVKTVNENGTKVMGDTNNENLETTVEDNNEKNTILIDESKEFAYIQEEKFSCLDIRTGKYVDAVNKIPNLNVNTEYAKTINNKIQEVYEEKEEYEYINGYIYEYNDIVSIVISTPNVFSKMLGGGEFNYNVFNIDKNTGKEVYNETILKTSGLSYDNVYDSILKFIKERFKNTDERYSTNKTNLKNEISDDSLKMYVNDSGKLNVVFYTLTEFEACQYNITYVLGGKDIYENLTYKYNVEIILENDKETNITEQENIVTTQVVKELTDERVLELAKMVLENSRGSSDSVVKIMYGIGIANNGKQYTDTATGSLYNLTDLGYNKFKAQVLRNFSEKYFEELNNFKGRKIVIEKDGYLAILEGTWSGTQHEVKNINLDKKENDAYYYTVKTNMQTGAYTNDVSYNMVIKLIDNNYVIDSLESK